MEYQKEISPVYGFQEKITDMLLNISGDCIEKKEEMTRLDTIVCKKRVPLIILLVTTLFVSFNIATTKDLSEFSYLVALITTWTTLVSFPFIIKLTNYKCKIYNYLSRPKTLKKQQKAYEEYQKSLIKYSPLLADINVQYKLLTLLNNSQPVGDIDEYKNKVQHISYNLECKNYPVALDFLIGLSEIATLQVVQKDYYAKLAEKINEPKLSLKQRL